MTVYVIQAPDTDDAGLQRARFIKDGFSWPAFVFAQVWLIYHRLWIPLLVWVVLEVAYFVFVVQQVPAGTSVAIDLLAHLFIGFEGSRLRQTKGARRAALIDLVEARDRDEAEVLFYRRHARPSLRDGAVA